MSSRRLAAAVLLLGLTAARAAAQTTGCTEITAVPYTISSPGIYCLTANLSYASSSGAAITITTDGVTVDLNGHTLSGSAPSNSASGVLATGSARLTVRNGTIKSFFAGVYVSGAGSNAHVIERLRLWYNWHYGIYVYGAGSVVRDCEVHYTGASTLDPNAVGIQIGGAAAASIGNVVHTVTAGAGGVSRGIYAVTFSQSIVGNRVSGAMEGITMSWPSTKYRDNIVFGTTPYVGGTDIGNNN